MRLGLLWITLCSAVRGEDVCPRSWSLPYANETVPRTAKKTTTDTVPGFPPWPDISGYAVEHSGVQCVIRHGGKLEALWILRGNFSAKGPVPKAYYRYDGGVSEDIPLQDVSGDTAASVRRYWLYGYPVRVDLRRVFFYFQPCYRCHAHWTECEPAAAVPWLPLWSSFHDVRRLLHESRRLTAYYVMFVKSFQYTLMCVMAIQVFWGTCVQTWPYHDRPWLIWDHM
ncbi:membrane glycoprotein US11 [Panine betaherpesvirus 2]|uniref:Membrane glycoprotein US11 n=1 Tax=Panine betaherpesvirus 2 TaxID=188763 RepID=Q8QRU8_9BETA|nr:membrane glycoprotein US11 [Panine betaherpesvirus 2]AAM00790.1 membrane glycoprotein US11 [Panine betaherpesvirus 2]QXV67908.1 membrane glycoprotein US11 [Panine betaherpesvirus 2]